MRIGRFIIGTVVAGGLVYTVAYFIRNAQLLKNTTVNMNGIKVNKLGEKTSLTATLKLDNKSDIPFMLHGGNIKASINGVPTADIAIKQKEKVRPRESTLIPLDIYFNLFQAINSLKGAVSTAKLQGLKAVSISLRGNLTVSSGILLFNRIPVDLTFNAGDFIKV